ncbi:glycoside hydrolase family 36 protein [Spirochaeta thermophila]|uniref:Alpha-galactosidase n=1 Tax=Winmispira thermophila (strain ATCC 49972 / DSM 6192 / RI 19.B1) TaxID=665571 RepID=E0RPQ4_WINT6|nr:alpha-galactosidase [Spirochaeta thermophila]ADN01368.1 alpha-galactosidase [Spirochaeta thermophila DSM 6192]
MRGNLTDEAVGAIKEGIRTKEEQVRLCGLHVQEGRFVHSFEGGSLSFQVERMPLGWVVRGTVEGRPGRLEVVRLPLRFPLLLQSWESWGACPRVDEGWRFPWGERQYEDWRYTVSLVPELMREGVVSDYLAAWEGGLAGFLTSRYAHGFFTVEGEELVGYLEFFDRVFDGPVPLEPLVVLEGGEIWDLLEVYATMAGRENRARVPAHSPLGWCSWYHYFLDLTWDDVRKNLALAKEWPFEVFQVDDAYEADIGDWLEPKEGFPPVEEMARTIREAGFTPGIWTAPFCASATSRLFREHPEWFVKEGGVPLVAFRNWGKDIHALDLSNPEVQAHLSRVFSSLRAAGYGYFKIDFLFAGAVPGERVMAVSPVEAYRMGLETIRAAVGDAFILGCGAPLLPSVGLVDGMRIGPDTTPFWDPAVPDNGAPAIQYALRNALYRSFMHRRFWLNDPDCLLLRKDRISLTEEERRTFALTAGALDGMLVVSDDLSLVDAAGRGLLDEALSLTGGRPRVGDLGGGCYEVVSEGTRSGRVRLVVNLGEEEAGGVAPHGVVLEKEEQGLGLSRRVELREGRRFTYYHREE